jgi:hypothetical protein
MLGVTDVMKIGGIDGTESEGRMLAQWADQQHLGSMVVVSAKNHSRPMRRVLDQDMNGDPTQVTVRAARYSVFGPDRWRESRTGVRTAIFEIQKLLLDFLRHPFHVNISTLCRAASCSFRAVCDKATE